MTRAEWAGLVTSIDGTLSVRFRANTVNVSDGAREQTWKIGDLGLSEDEASAVARYFARKRGVK